MKTIDIYKIIKKPPMDRGVIVTGVEPSKRGRGSYKRKTKYGQTDEHGES